MTTLSPWDDVKMRIEIGASDNPFIYQHAFSAAHLDSLCRPPFPRDPMHPAALYDYQRRLEQRRKIVDMIAMQIAACIADAFERKV